MTINRQKKIPNYLCREPEPVFPLEFPAWNIDIFQQGTGNDIRDQSWERGARQGAAREFIPNDPITPAPREALKGNKRVDEIQNLSEK